MCHHRSLPNCNIYNSKSKVLLIWFYFFFSVGLFGTCKVPYHIPQHSLLSHPPHDSSEAFSLFPQPVPIMATGGLILNTAVCGGLAYWTTLTIKASDLLALCKQICPELLDRSLLIGKFLKVKDHVCPAHYWIPRAWYIVERLETDGKMNERKSGWISNKQNCERRLGRGRRCLLSPRSFHPI